MHIMRNMEQNKEAWCFGKKRISVMRNSGAGNIAIGIILLVYRSYSRNYFYYQWSQSVKT